MALISTLVVVNTLLWTVIDYFLTHDRVRRHFLNNGHWNGSVDRIFTAWRILLAIVLLTVTVTSAILGTYIIGFFLTLLSVIGLCAAIVTFLPEYLERGEEYVEKLIEAAEVDKEQ